VDAAEMEQCGVREILSKPCQLGDIQAAIEAVRTNTAPGD